MDIIKIIENARKLSNEQVNLLKELFTKGKYNIYSLLGKFLTLTAAGALYKCSIDTYNVDMLNSIAYAILGTHLVFKNYIIAMLTSTSFAFSIKGDKKQRIKEMNKMVEELRETLRK